MPYDPTDPLTPMERVQAEQKARKTAFSKLASALAKFEEKDRYRRRFLRMKDIRFPMEDRWRQVRDYLDPAAGKWLDGDDSVYESRVIDDSHILDDAPRKMAQTAADGLHGGLTSPATRWFSFYSGDYSKFDAEATHAEKMWLNTAEECVRDVLSKSNFYTAVHPFRKECLEFGVALMLIYSDDNTYARCYPYTVGSFWLAQDSKRRIDTVATRTVMTAMDLAVTYGWSKLPLCVKNAIELDGDPDKKFSLIQMIQPWGYFGGGADNKNNFQFEDVHFVEEGADTDGIIYRGGFRTRPFVVSRWGESYDDVYPRTCPGIDALPSIRQLYQSTKNFNMAVEWASNPAWAVDAMLRQDMDGVKPGDIIEIQGSAGREMVRALVPPVFNFEANLRLRQMLVENISGIFYNREIMMVSSRAQNNHVMTATEVDQLRNEKNAVMGPITTRQGDADRDVLARYFELITEEWVILDAPPDSLLGRNVEPYFTSDMAVSQRSAWIQRANDGLAWLQAVAPMYPGIRHSVDFDRWFREYEKTDALPSVVFNDPKKVEEMVAAEQQAMAQQQQMQAMTEMAKAGKDLGATPTTGDNMAAELSTEMASGPQAGN